MQLTDWETVYNTNHFQGCQVDDCSSTFEGNSNDFFLREKIHQGRPPLFALLIKINK
jgi:hypothetical protein